MTLLENLQNDARHFLSAETAAAPLLKRVLLFLEDGEFTQADAYCEKVLDVDPENPLAYLYKLMASRRLQSIPELADAQYVIDTEAPYKKCVRFAPETMRQHLHALNMHIYTNCIAACRKRAQIHMAHNELKETAQQYHTAMKLWEDSKATLPNAQGIYDDLADEVADFNWKLLLANRECTEDQQLVTQALPLETDRWYQSACKWAGDRKRSYFESVAGDVLFQTHLKCMAAIGNRQIKVAEIWAEHYQAAASDDDILPQVHSTLIATKGYTVFAPGAVKAMLDLIRLYETAYPQGTQDIKARLQDYYPGIFQSYVDFSDSSVLPSIEEITGQMADAASGGYSPFDVGSTYWIPANALTVRYAQADGIITNIVFFRFVCEYYQNALANTTAEQAEEIRKRFNDFLINAVRLPSSNTDIAQMASACMNGSALPYQLYLSRLTNDYSVDKAQLIPQQLNDELIRWYKMIESANPKKDCFWLCDQQDSILSTFTATENAIQTCSQFSVTLQRDLQSAYDDVMTRAGGHCEELASVWSQKMNILQENCSELADELRQELEKTRELNNSKLAIAQKHSKRKGTMQMVRGIASIVFAWVTSLAFSTACIPAVMFGLLCANDPGAVAEYPKTLFFCVNIGLPILSGCLCLINCWAVRHYDKRHIRKKMWLFAIFSVLSHLVMGIVSNRLLLDPPGIAVILNLTPLTIYGFLLVPCGIAHTLLDGSFSKLSQRAWSRAVKITCKVGTIIALLLLLRQALECFLVAGLFLFALITG